jgi:16S rRNA (cytosine967-C5)-methyltransferase
MVAAMDGVGVVVLEAREAAFLALVSKEKISNFLLDWKMKEHPADKDFHLAETIAYGTCRMALALDWIAKELTPLKKLHLKSKERILLRSALYQCCFMDRVPLYAVANESGRLAKKYFHSQYVKFLNAILRRCEKGLPQLPNSDRIEDLSIRFSYPKYFVKEIVEQLGVERAKEVMRLQNLPGSTWYRVRPGVEMKEAVGAVQIAKIAKSDRYSIQNQTPSSLMDFLSGGVGPKTILDLCASPGGKLLWLYDHFPGAKLVANEPVLERIPRLKENILKYALDVEVTSHFGQNYPKERSFDLIVIDAPCSNSGVLNKRAEARWRLEEEEVKKLEELQLSLIAHALTLLNPGGEIWYMTCSILRQENEEVVKRSGARCSKSKLILPNGAGFDGGFGAVLQ